MYTPIPITPPALRMGDPRRKFVNIGDSATLLRSTAWVLTSAPPEIKVMTVDLFRDLKPVRTLDGKPTLSPTKLQPVPIAR